MKQLCEAASDLVGRLKDLMTDSRGVYGLHLNGDHAPWDSLTAGGQYEGWLMDSIDVLELEIERSKDLNVFISNMVSVHRWNMVSNETELIGMFKLIGDAERFAAGRVFEDETASRPPNQVYIVCVANRTTLRVFKQASK